MRLLRGRHVPKTRRISGAAGGFCRSARCRARLLLLGILLASGLTLGADDLAFWPDGSVFDGTHRTAWADNLSNKAVPTDDTGVVDSSGAEPSKDAGEAPSTPPASEGEEGHREAGSIDGAQQGSVETPSDGESSASEAADGDQAVDAGDTPEVIEAKPVVPDPVFGTERNEKNLLNPQQKPDSSFIYDTSISDLQEADLYLNDQTVQVTGEVVGDRIKAEFDPGYCWIVLQSNDGSYMEVPVFLDSTLTDSIDTYGSYGRKGTTLQIRGIFHLACSDHEGLTDLHADSVSVVSKGYMGEREFDIAAFLPGMVLVTVGLIMLLVFRQMREGQR